MPHTPTVLNAPHPPQPPSWLASANTAGCDFPIQNLPYARWPQVGVQLLLAGLGIYYFQKKWQHQIDLYTFSLVALSIMPMLFYSFSPMLFRYYFLMPLCVSAVLCWKVIAVEKQNG